jgi:hypothetical protein
MRLSCDMCSRTFGDASALMQHQRYKHGVRRKKLPREYDPVQARLNEEMGIAMYPGDDTPWGDK